ncbi:hypothetical protein ACFY3U_20010 [Micromonospora sp. NPDC000089]|uniref:hypothetical protein n=1 Tax=unclassified Micromonospora TaxID=2617518 RepID=UPI0036B18474
MRTFRTLVAALVAAALTALWAAAPAVAHSGKLKLTVGGDGAGGVTVQAVHADGHRLDQPLRLTVTAAGPGGRKVGPVPLDPSGEGQGFYASGPLLAPGRWTVTVSTPAPFRSTATAQVQAKAVPSPARPASVAPAEPARAAAPAAAQRAPEPAAAQDDAGGGAWWAVAAGALLVAALSAIALARRRRATR